VERQYIPWYLSVRVLKSDIISSVNIYWVLYFQELHMLGAKWAVMNKVNTVSDLLKCNMLASKISKYAINWQVIKQSVIGFYKGKIKDRTK
jgi:hypothetical protein